MNKEFMNSSYYDFMRKDILQQYRRIGHALDNYGGDMSSELREGLEELYRVTEKVNYQMREDYAKSIRADK